MVDASQDSLGGTDTNLLWNKRTGRRQLLTRLYPRHDDRMTQVDN